MAGGGAFPRGRAAAVMWRAGPSTSLREGACDDMDAGRNDTKLDAEWLRLRLAYGLCDAGAVVAWAEDRILDASRPPAVAVEIAGAPGLGVQDLMGILAAVPGQVDPDVVRARIFAELADRLRAQPQSLVDVVWHLRRLALNGGAPDEATADEIDALDALCAYLESDGEPEDLVRSRALDLLDRKASPWRRR